MGIISTFITTPAHAEPSYLICKLTYSGDKVVSYSVKVDEANGMITHSFDEVTFNAKGFFSANTISYQDSVIANKNDGSSITYAIDRTTLKAIAVTSWVFAGTTNEATLGEGSCEVEKVKDRKI